MRLLIRNIKTLAQVETGAERKSRVYGQDMGTLPCLDDAWLYAEQGMIHSFGTMDTLPAELQADETIDASGRMVLPTWCDSHTHLVFAAPREQEFMDRIKGLSYEEIARRGGGILNSARRLNETSEEQLFEQALQRLEAVIAQGTGAIEIKSGYGLCTEGELKMLRVIRRLKEVAPIPVKASFLAAHAFPPEYKENHKGYIDLIIDEMLPRVAGEGLADYMDAFCEKGFFSVEETARLLEAGLKYGLKPKIHANQLHRSGGVQVGVQYNAISVDHLESMGEEEIDALKGSNTIPTLLPGAAFFLAMHYQPARALIDAGLPVALASDYNPGSCPSGNMNLLLSLACTQLKMTPEEAIHAQTINGAAAMELEQQLGTIARGKKASLILTRPVPSLAYLPYSFGENWIERVIV
ncbi:imidazolonepropionase [Taibaiella chishuiensis]|uniref:Imidazolonepropionase n=1 Tax=Taibaiella chishuiensis TaxID=1434707 RepID=A0A2P8DDS3_9BACT|nr:imidazolonepropionase [Taibaiella chishuiensis]PSK95339.1 imidazolonepropionase [Taibaiella chishuiensis]